MSQNDEQQKISNALNEFVEKLKSLVLLADAAFQIEPNETVPLEMSTLEKAIKQAAEIVSHKITLFSIAFNNCNKAEECVPSIDPVLSSSEGLVQISCTILSQPTVGSTLRKTIAYNVQSLLNAIIQLAISFAKRDYANNSIPKLTGVKAIVKSITDNVLLMKDALNELRTITPSDDLNEKDQEFNLNNNDNDEDLDSFDEFEKFTAKEYELVLTAAQVCNIAFSFTQKLSHFIEEQTIPMTKESVVWLEKIKTAVELLQSNLDKFILTIYPPQNKETTLKEFKEFQNSFNAIIELLQMSELKNDKFSKIMLITQQSLEIVARDLTKETNNKNNNNNSS